MSATRALGMISMNRSSFDRCNRILDKAGFVDRVGMNRYLDIVLVGNLQTSIDCRRGRAPILMQLQSAGAGFNLFRERRQRTGISLAQETKIHGPMLGGFEHTRNIPRARRAGGRISPGRWTIAATGHGRDAVRERD